MIIFIIFLSLWLGLAFRSAIWIFAIVAIVFLFFIFKRFGFKLTIISTAIIAVGVSFSLIKMPLKQNKTQFNGVVYAVKDNYFLLNSSGERLYVYQRGHSYDIGDYLSIEGKREDLSFATIESSFDFNDYLNKRGVYHALKAKTIDVKFHNFIRINERREKVLKQFNEEERSIVGLILFSNGEESDLTDDIKELHLARFLSASGIYVSVFASVLTFLFALFLKDKYAELVAIIVLGLYTIFTFPRFSVLKIFLLLLIRWINKYPLKKKFTYLTLVSSLGIFSLLINRYLAYQDSFILGFSIPLISYLTRQIGGKGKIKPRIYKILLIYLFFIPFEINYYNKIVILSLPFQLLVTPLFFLVSVTSLLCFFYVPLYGMNKFFISILKWFISFIKYAAFGIYFPDFSGALYLIYYATYFIYLYYLSIGFVPIHRSLIIGKIAFLLLYAFPINNCVSTEVSFVNVGQGDCTLIRYHNYVALIDTGGLTTMDVATSSLVPYLRSKRIYKIDAIFITHYDFDHYGALESLKEHYSVKSVYDYNSTYPVNVHGVEFTNYNHFYEDDSEENQKSLVLGFELSDTKYLIMGDATSYVEKQIIKEQLPIECDILKVGHHGSDTSSCEEFIKYVSPSVAVISCGKNNKFGHPSKSVIATLKKYQIEIRRTDLEGTITYRKMFV